MDEVVFYRDWLALDKGCFRLLVMLAENGSFSGNLSDMCRYFQIDPQDKTRKKLRASIQELEDGGWIETEQTGRTFHLKAVPRGKEIHLPREWMGKIVRHEYSAADVAWEQVLKILLWLIDCGSETLITDKMIAAEIGISDSTVSAAKKVLREDLGLLMVVPKTTRLPNGEYYRVGHWANVNAWLSTE